MSGVVWHPMQRVPAPWCSACRSRMPSPWPTGSPVPPYRPPGCHIHLQRQTREQGLQGLRTLTTQNWRRLNTELQTYGALRGRAAVRLAGFLHDQALELEDVYRAGTGQGRSGWTALKRDA